MENQLEKKMENEMETRECIGIIRVCLCSENASRAAGSIAMSSNKGGVLGLVFFYGPSPRPYPGDASIARFRV